MPRYVARSVENTEKELLVNRNPDTPLGPFDGRVGALYGHTFYITSPNHDEIFTPPGPDCTVYARIDGRYGQDDHMQWPQPFSPTYPHLCCIPWPNSLPDKLIWWDPDIRDFHETRLHGQDTGFRKLPIKYLNPLVVYCNKLLEEYKGKNDSIRSHHLAASLAVNLTRGLNRLRAISMSYREALISVRYLQRLWLELRALMDYLEIYRPRMELHSSAPPKVANVIGCFVHDVHVAERLFAAGIPYWLVRENSTFSSENILSIVTPIPPDNLLQLEDFRPPFPRIHMGDSNDQRYLRIFNYGCKALRYADPFSTGQPKGINPHEFAQTARSSDRTRQVPRRPTNRKEPYTKRLSSQTVSRDKFKTIDSPYMPPASESWRKALELVDNRPEMLYSPQRLSPNDGKYAFPEPALFCSVDNPTRRNHYLTVWEMLRPLFVYRMSSGGEDIQLFSGQEWRTLLHGRSGSSNPKSNGASLLSSLLEKLSSQSSELGIDLSQLPYISDNEYTVSQTHQLLWELSELSFRFELLNLDRRAISMRVIEDEKYKSEFLSPHVREDLILKCFHLEASDPCHLAYVSPAHAQKGLASPTIQARLPFLKALRSVMFEWDGYESHHLCRLVELSAHSPEIELLHYENAITRFYAQSFFRFFGRAAVLPTVLP